MSITTAIIGTGPMGRRLQAAAGRIERCKLVALADRNPSALKAAMADAHGSIAGYLDGSELLRELRPQLVLIATNGPSHVALVEAACSNGASFVLCEKPMACSMSEVDRMRAAVNAAGTRLAVNHCRRYLLAYDWLRDRIASGEYGRLRSMRFSCPGIGLGCLGTHFIDLMRYLSGDPAIARVWALVDQERRANPRGAEYHDPGGLVVIETSDGMRLMLDQIEDGAGPMTGVIDLTGARIVIEEQRKRIDIIHRDLSITPGPGRPPVFNEIQVPSDIKFDLDIIELSARLIDNLIDSRPLVCSMEHGAASLEAVLAAHLSATRGNTWVPVPLTRQEERDFWISIT